VIPDDSVQHHQLGVILCLLRPNAAWSILIGFEEFQSIQENEILYVEGLSAEAWRFNLLWGIEVGEV
jgi:hypothetical protein